MRNAFLQSGVCSRKVLLAQEWDEADDPDKTHEFKQTIRIVSDSAGKVSAKLLKETHE
jgi:hypothetical protein